MSLTDVLPFNLSDRPTFAALIERTGVHWDVAIGSLPFFVDTSVEPVRRSTKEFVREQFDNAAEVGEQSLSGWWLRSQSRFDDGAGITYLEPLAGDGSGRRFHSSVGLDVFSSNEVSLCRRMDDVSLTSLGTPVDVAQGTSTIEILGTGAYGSISSSGTYTEDAVTTIPTGAVSLTVDHDDNRIVGATGGIYSEGSALWTTSNGAVKAWYVKDRLYAAQGGDLFELSLTGGNLDAETPLSVPVASTTGWEWIRVVETPGAAWAVGVDNFDQARVFVITVDDGTPPSTIAVEALTLPVGESVISAYGYLDFIILGTSRGIRVCPTSGTSAALGPVIGDETPIYSVGAFGDSVYGAGQASHDGFSGVYRVDLSRDLGDGFYPWAKETYGASSAQPLSVRFLPGNDRRAVLVTTDAVALQSTTHYLTSGWIQTGFTRWGTFENKWFDNISVRCATNSGTLTVSSVDETSSYSIGSVVNTASGNTLDIELPGVPRESLAFNFLMSSGSSGTTTPTLRGYQLRGYPTPVRQRIIRVPVKILDYERDRYGVKYGKERWGMARQFGLEALEEAGRPIMLQDFRTGETRQVTIIGNDHIQQWAPDGKYPNAEGVTLVTMLALDMAQFGADDFNMAG